jgi:hypothetical protein
MDMNAIGFWKKRKSAAHQFPESPDIIAWQVWGTVSPIGDFNRTSFQNKLRH